MIATLEGILTESTPVEIVLENAGVGYAVFVPLSTADRLPGLGQKVKLFTYAVYREDSQALYGFATREEKAFFRLLVEKVSGIGPKIALSILSKMPIATLEQAIAEGNVTLLSKCPGIGKKTAERLVIELRDKVTLPGSRDAATAADAASGTALAGAPDNLQDAVAALMSLGYKPADADKAIRKAADKLGKDADTSSLIKEALR